MNIPDRETLEQLKKDFPVGCRIVLDEMDDPYRKIPKGSQGTVLGIDDTGSIIPAWDTGGSLHILYRVDHCHKIGNDEEAKVTLDFYGKYQVKDNAVCPRCGAIMYGSSSRHALSRWAEIMVCDQCGMQEALEQAKLIERLPLMQWTAIRMSQSGAGPWRLRKEPVDPEISELIYNASHEVINDLTGRHCCLTGNFAYGSKEDIAAYIETHGGIVDKSLKKSTDYLVIGALGSQYWKAGSSNKISHASEMRASGSAIGIITESDFFREIEAFCHSECKEES